MKIKILSTLLLLLFSVGCKNSMAVPSDLIGNEACSPPCWNNILPGATTRDEAIRILEDMSDQGLGGSLISSEPDPLNWYGSDSAHYQDNRYIYTDNGVVVSIDLYLVNVNLDWVTNQFGPPEYLGLYRDRGGWFFKIFYPSQGLEFDGNGSVIFNRIYIRSTAKLNEANFVAPTELEKMIAVIYGEDNAVYFVSGVQPWPGYGSFPLP